MARDDVEIQVVGRETSDDVNSVDYQPFGVKVLKLKVRRNQAKDPRPDLKEIWLRPQGYVPPDAEADDPARWRVYGTAQDDPDLWVAWGAGDERGFCVKTKDTMMGINKEPAPLDDDVFHYVYLHLIHRPPDPSTHVPADKTLVVQAVDRSGQVYGEKAVRLTVPAGATNPVRAHWDWDLDASVSTVRLRGADDGPSQLPLYFSRWWPLRQVEYLPVQGPTAQFLQDLKITFHRQDRGKIDVSLGDEPLARFDGDLALPLHDYRLFSTEVLRFLDDRHLVLRFWFYWVHLGFSVDQLLTYVPPARRDGWRDEAERVLEGLKGVSVLGRRIHPWRKSQEVPDVERFDLLLDPQDLTLKFVGTDTHWQEFWAVVDDDEPLKASIATWEQMIKVARQAKSVPDRDPPIFDPLANGLCYFVHEERDDECPHRPYSGQASVKLVTADVLPDVGFDYATCSRCGSHFTDKGVRAVGTYGKHAPLLANATVLEDAVSTSVLKG